MNLNLLITESRFIVSPGRTDAPFFLPPIEFGNVQPIELRGWKKIATGEIVSEDLASYQISLLVGPPNVRPSLGFWQLTTTRGTSKPMPARLDKVGVADALRSALGACTVEGGNGSYIVSPVAVGIWALPTTTFQGNTLSSVLVFEITPGTSTTPAQYRIEVLEVAPARVIPANWTAGDTTPVNAFTQIGGRLWQLTLDQSADSGFFTLTVDGVTTDFVNFSGGAYQIAVALAAAGKLAEVITNSLDGYWIKFAQDATVCSVGSNLLILPFSKGNLDLTSTGIRELLDGLQFASVKLTVLLVKDGTTVTAASADVMLQMGVNQPATITIDAPRMAGLTFAISDDGAYLLVYQNGTFIGEVVLNAAA